jgi:hypothetical protein
MKIAPINSMTPSQKRRTNQKGRLIARSVWSARSLLPLLTAEESGRLQGASRDTESAGKPDALQTLCVVRSPLDTRTLDRLPGQDRGEGKRDEQTTEISEPGFQRVHLP